MCFNRNLPSRGVVFANKTDGFTRLSTDGQKTSSRKPVYLEFILIQVHKAYMVDRLCLLFTEHAF